MAVTGDIIAFYAKGERFVERLVQLTFTVNYPTGGDTLDLTQLTNNARIDGARQFSRLPVITHPLNEGSGGYYIEVVPGATLATFKIKVYAPAGTEHPAAAYNAAVSAPSSPFAIGMVHKAGV